jgi:hypothetical protein
MGDCRVDQHRMMAVTVGEPKLERLRARASHVESELSRYWHEPTPSLAKLISARLHRLSGFKPSRGNTRPKGTRTRFCIRPTLRTDPPFGHVKYLAHFPPASQEIWNMQFYVLPGDDLSVYVA